MNCTIVLKCYKLAPSQIGVQMSIFHQRPGQSLCGQLTTMNGEPAGGQAVNGALITNQGLTLMDWTPRDLLQQKLKEAIASARAQLEHKVKNDN